MDLTSVDLTPVVQAVATLAGTALTIFGSLALRAVEKKFSFQLTQEQTSAWDSALKKSLAYATVKAEDLIAAKGWDHVEVKDRVVQGALTYLTSKFPDVLKQQGLVGPQAQDTILAALARTMPGVFSELAASPATPPAGTGK